MKLDHDVVRSLLLAIESSDTADGFDIQTTEQFGDNLGLTHDQTGYTVEKLIEAGFVTGRVNPTLSDRYFAVYAGNLTYDGHQYLDTVRDAAVWKSAKENASALASVSLTLMWQIATAVTMQKLGLQG